MTVMYSASHGDHPSMTVYPSVPPMMTAISSATLSRQPAHHGEGCTGRRPPLTGVFATKSAFARRPSQHQPDRQHRGAGDQDLQAERVGDLGVDVHAKPAEEHV